MQVSTLHTLQQVLLQLQYLFLHYMNGDKGSPTLLDGHG